MPVLALTMGDARGIGPEVLLKALAHNTLAGKCEPLIVGVARAFQNEAELLWPEGKFPPAVEQALKRVVEIDVSEEIPQSELDNKGLREFLLANPAIAGKWSGKAVERAYELVASGEADALVTAPLDKSALNLGGYRYPGHTEMLASLAGGLEVSMMLVADRLRVVPATTHVALARVPRMLTVDLLLSQCRIIHRGLRQLFGIESPRIALCGLNPHLGDSGLAGDEDEKITSVAAEAARREGLPVFGPYPADTVFVRAARGEFDAVLAMYHDQAMIPVKMHAFGRGVNITLGLPFVRTSPDHGTALDIAGQARADESSMLEAVKLAARLGRTGFRGSQ
jgi:4-hydroxythreonine-4-phosphate dehydrogenase